MPLDGEPFRGGDPKAGPKERKPIRTVDKAAGKASALRRPECAACGYPATNHHHVVRKGSPHFGDDVEENLAPLCGSGSSGCHGALHGSSYTDKEGVKWTKSKVAKKIGGWIQADPERMGYALAKAGPDYLARVYYVTVSTAS